MEYSDQELSTISKLLEPYFKRIIMQFYGGWIAADGESLVTDKYEGWGGIGMAINGTVFPSDDLTGGARGWGAVDLQLNPSNDPALCAQANFSFIAGGENNNIHATAEAAVAGGSGADVPQNAKAAFVMGAYLVEPGDCQTGRYTFGKSITMSSGWQDIASLYMEPDDKAVAFEARITGFEQGGANSFAYRIEGLAENDGGTMSILASTVTPEYEDDANYDVQVVANGSSDKIDFQVTDSGNAGRVCKWCLRIDTAEICFAV